MGKVLCSYLTSSAATAIVYKQVDTEKIIKEADGTKLYTVKGIVRVGERGEKVQQKGNIKDDFVLFDVFDN